MQCPKCGADNPEGAEYCSLCLDKLPVTQPAHVATDAPASPDGYVAPGEWRGDAEFLSPRVSSVVERKMRRLYIRFGIYSLLTLGFIAWLTMSLTVWGNPSPAKQSSKLIQSLNARNASDFDQLVLSDAQSQGQLFFNDILVALGNDGKFENVTFNVSQSDDYTYRASITGGNITSGIYGPTDLGQYQNLVLVFENHKGKWYLNPRDSVLVPY